MEPFTLVVVDPDLLWRTDVRNAVAPHPVLEVPTVEGATASLSGEGPVGLVLGPNAIEEALPRLDDLRSRCPGLLVVAVTERVSVDLLQRAMRAGVYDVVDVAAGRELLAPALAGAIAQLGAGAAEVATATAAARPGTLLVVTAAKAGEGSTTVAGNVAAAIAAGGARRVILVEGDARFGDLALTLGLPAPALGPGFDDLPVERHALEAVLQAHPSTGLRVLVPSRSTRPFDPSSESHVVAVISAAQSLADVVVVDAPFHLVEATGLLGLADRVLLVTDLDTTSLKNSMVAVQVLGEAAAGEVLQVVVNRCPAEAEAAARDAAEIIGMEVAVTLPVADGIGSGRGDGVPAVIRAPEEPFGRGIGRLVDRLQHPVR